MKKSDQRKFVRDLTKSVLSGVLAESTKWPEGWDGHELRALLADRFVDNSTFHNTPIIGSMTKRRVKEYNNDKAVLNIR